MMTGQAEAASVPGLFDSHCHVNEERFDEDREEVLARMAEHGVTRYAVIGSDMPTSAACAEYCKTRTRPKHTGRATWIPWRGGSVPARRGLSAKSGWTIIMI